MSALRSWLGRPDAAPASRETVDTLIDWLTPDQVITLAGLHGAPPGVANAVVQLLPFGSRTSLEELGLVVPDEQASDQGGRRRVVLTPLAYDVMSVLAARSLADPDGVADWTRRAEIAATFPETGRNEQG